MPIPRIYVSTTLQQGCDTVLDSRATGHVSRVLRMRSGDTITLFNGDGWNYIAEIIDTNKDGVRCRITDKSPCDTESPLTLVLAQGISRGERMDYTIQKAVELGVNKIIPLDTARSQVKLTREREAKRLKHWHGIIVHACEQSGRATIPELHSVSTLTDWLETFSGPGLRVMLDPEGNRTLHTLCRATNEITLLIGPEGGMSPQEREMAAAAGFERVRLGPRILRTETAAIAALAAIQSYNGDLC